MRPVSFASLDLCLRDGWILDHVSKSTARPVCTSTYFFLDSFAESFDYWEGLGVEFLKSDTANEFDESAGCGLHVGRCANKLVNSE